MVNKFWDFISEPKFTTPIAVLLSLGSAFALLLNFITPETTFILCCIALLLSVPFPIRVYLEARKYK